MKKDDADRRTFLKSLFVGSAVAAGVTATVKPLKADQPGNSRTGTETLYRETEAFKQYYQSVGYQTNKS